tara:strand:+ start:907 stop:1056 length:150 start_codon:yes stop_codon:yes gene_type:complete
MEKEEIEFIKDRIIELEKFQKRGITNIAWFDGKSFSVELALTTFKNVLI